MADTENFTAEQADQLLQEAFASINGKEPVATSVEEKPALEQEPAAPVVDSTQEEPTPAKSAEEVPENKEPEPAKPGKDDAYAWLNDVPEAVRDKVQAEINERKNAFQQWASNNGRIRSMQQMILELKRELAGRTPAETPAPAPSTPTTPEGWNTLIKDDPELANAVEARIKAEVEAAVGPLKDKLQEVQKSGDALYEDRHQQYVEEQRTALKAHVSNYEEVVTSPAYKHWLENIAGDGVRNLALTSLDHRDAISVLREYAADMVRLGYAKAPEQQAPASAAKPAADTTTADAFVAERNRKAVGASVGKQPVIAPAGKPDLKGPVSKEEQDSIFLEAWKKLHPTTST